MITPLLELALEPTVRRHRRFRQFAALAVCMGIVALCALLLARTGHQGSGTVFLVLVVGFFLTRYAWQKAAAVHPDYLAIARTVETQHPELNALLVTAVEQQPDPRSKSLHFLQQRVIANAVEQCREQLWQDTIPRSRWLAVSALNVLLFGAVIWSVALLGKVDQRIMARQKAKAVAAADEAVTVTPGDTDIERGSGLVILATFNQEVPNEAILVIEPQNAPMQRISLVKNLNDPVFGGGLPEVDAPLRYRIEYASESTRDFTVKVFEHPRLDRADATLHFPEYTKLPDRSVPDTRRVSAVEGTKLDVAFQLNKPVKEAQLVSKDGTKIPLAVDPAKPLATLRDMPVQQSHNFELALIDSEGRSSKIPAQFNIEALPNRRPELKLVTPRGDVRVSSIEEVAFRTEAWDDFGLTRYGLSYTLSGQEAKEVELGKDTRPDEKQQAAHLLQLEKIGVNQDELISWFLWAEDVGPDGKLRRTATDMFFAEVRPFEEIFRPGDSSDAEQQQQQQQQQQGASRQAMKLAEMQKQIITATWNLKRTEDANTSAEKPAKKYLEDVPVVRDSQTDALNQAEALADKAEAPKSKALIENVQREMQAALDRLNEAEKTAEPLPQAVASEQSAYNALLKLAAHEFQVTKGRQRNQSGQQSGQERQQAQLDQLEMKDERKRYETKREATPEQQNAEQRDQLAILNRLKELAQRQQDINERLKELQNALQAAETEQQKEEIRRELKRLREQEQQLIADMDETRQKMEQSPQQSQLAEERRQMDETRSEAQQASEALERNAASQALASGTRAEKQLQQMRDDFRKKTSGQFNEQMREMRNDARELAQKQQEIADKLAEEPKRPERPTLDGKGEREQLSTQFDKQKEDLSKLTQDMRRVSEEAEAAEPLLAKELYDTLRKTAQSDTEKTLAMTSTLAQRGYAEQARKFEEKARQEIEEVKDGVERAAASVLGDEAEALRRARAELDDLTEQLNREIARARPDLADAREQTNRSRSGEDPSGEQRAAADQQQPGESAAQRQPGENQQGGSERAGAAGEQQEPRQRPGESGRAPQPGQGERGENPDTSARTGGGAVGEQGDRQRASEAAAQQGKAAGAEQSPEEKAEVLQRMIDRRRQQITEQRNQQRQDESQPGQAEQGQQGQQGGQRGGGGQNDQGTSPSQAEGAAPNRPQSRLAELANSGQRPGGQQRGGDQRGGGGGPADNLEQAGPLTGEQFVQWSDRLRNVEETLDDPALRNEAARVREIARGMRVEFKRHSKEPNWDLVNSQIRTPLAELRNRVTEELARRDSKENLVPIDRDQVPTKFADRVRRYYEELGRSR